MRLYAKRADVVLLKDKKPLYERLILVFKMKTKKRKLQRERRGGERQGGFIEREGGTMMWITLDSNQNKQTIPISKVWLYQKTRKFKNLLANPSIEPRTNWSESTDLR